MVDKNKPLATIEDKSADSLGVGQLRAFIERIERCEEEAMVELYLEALGMPLFGGR